MKSRTVVRLRSSVVSSNPPGRANEILDLREKRTLGELEHEILYLATVGEVERIIPCPQFGAVLAVMKTEAGLDTMMCRILP